MHGQRGCSACPSALWRPYPHRSGAGRNAAGVRVSSPLPGAARFPHQRYRGSGGRPPCSLRGAVRKPRGLGSRQKSGGRRGGGGPEDRRTERGAAPRILPHLPEGLPHAGGSGLPSQPRHRLPPFLGQGFAAGPPGHGRARRALPGPARSAPSPPGAGDPRSRASRGGISPEPLGPGLGVPGLWRSRGSEGLWGTRCFRAETLLHRTPLVT